VTLRRWLRVRAAAVGAPDPSTEPFVVSPASWSTIDPTSRRSREGDGRASARDEITRAAPVRKFLIAPGAAGAATGGPVGSRAWGGLTRRLLPGCRVASRRSASRRVVGA